MNTDKVLALAKEAGYSIQIDVRNGLHTENIWGGELETAKVMRFAALIQREMEAENAELRKDAERFQYLQNLSVKDAQAFFWNYTSRKQRAAAIDKARSANDKG